MSKFVRPMVREGGMVRPANVGDGLMANFSPKAYAAETDETILLSELAGGYIFQGTTLTSDVTYTLPTAAAIIAAWDEMDIGDSFAFVVTNSQVGAFDVVIAVGTGITKVGTNNTLSVPPQSSRIFLLVKDSATAMSLY